MSLLNLPVEVLEKIFLYLDVEDIKHALEAVEHLPSEVFWKRVCRREGFSKLEGVHDTWSSVFQCDLNWRSGNFWKRQYERIFTEPNAPIDLQAGNLLSCFDNTLQVWNIATLENPILVQQIPARVCVQLCESKLLIDDGQNYKVYDLQLGQYHDLLLSVDHSSWNHCPITALSNDFCAVVDRDITSHVIILDLVRLEQFYCTLPQPVYVISMRISAKTLYIAWVQDSDSVLERFDLENRVLLNNVVLRKDITHRYTKLKLKTSPKLIVYAWVTKGAQRKLSGRLTILNENGELVKTILPSISCRSDLPLTLRWICVNEEYVVFSCFDSIELSIWNNRRPNYDPKTLSQLHVGGKPHVISKSLLLLITHNFCTIVDLRKAIFFHSIDFGRAVKDPYPLISINQCFIVLCQYCRVDTGKEKQKMVSDRSPDNEDPPMTYERMRNITTSKIKTESPKLIPVMTVYDFRGSFLP